MARSQQTLEDTDRLLRANKGSGNWINHPHWQPLHFVRLTNYGDGTAYDIRLSGDECRPRVWVGDTGGQKTENDPPTVVWPMWSDTIAALEPGQSVQVLVMTSPDRSRKPPALEARWPRMPRRGFGWKRCRYDLATARTIETGWPGERGE